MKNIGYLCVLLSLVIGCTDSKHYHNYEFDVVEKISTANIPINDSIFMKYPFRLAKNDSLLFILDLHAADRFVHVFNNNGSVYHNSLFKVGNGPDEFISISNIQLEGDSLYVFDSRNEIFVYHVDDLFRGVESPRRIKLTTDFGFLSRGLKLGDNFYFPVFNATNDKRILEFNNSGELIDSFGKIELSDRRTPIESATYQAWMPFLGGSDGVLVAATQFGDVVEIYNNQKQTTIKGEFGDPIFKNHKGFAIHEGIHGFQDVVVRNGYIYAMFKGVSMQDEQETEHGGNIIYVFDYDGTPKRKLLLDRRFITIYMDTDGSFLALDVNSNTPLYRFDIPE